LLAPLLITDELNVLNCSDDADDDSYARVPLDPVENHLIGFLRRLPEKAVRLALENFKLGAGNSILQRFSLSEVIAARRIIVADQHQRRAAHVAQAMGRFPVVARDDEMDVFGKLRVRRPGQLKKFFDLVGMLLSIWVGKERAGVAKLFAQRFLEAFFHKPDDQPMRQTGNAIRARPRRLASRWQP
jgi:hypothetical protein